MRETPNILFDRCISKYPIRIEALFNFLPYSWSDFLDEDTLERLLVVIFNDNDVLNRVVSDRTRIKVLDLFEYLLEAAKEEDFYSQKSINSQKSNSNYESSNKEYQQFRNNYLSFHSSSIPPEFFHLGDYYSTYREMFSSNYCLLRSRIRIALQRVNNWLPFLEGGDMQGGEDEKDEEQEYFEKEKTDEEKLTRKEFGTNFMMISKKRLLDLIMTCWKIREEHHKCFFNNLSSSSVQKVKDLAIKHYSITSFQSIVRSFLVRRKLFRMREEEKRKQSEEIEIWSVINIQRIIRGFLCRRSKIRSLLMRKRISMETLRRAERHLSKGDIWGLLLDFDMEFKRLKQEVKEVEERESNWAEKFVTKVVKYRQDEFDQAWEAIPKALQNFQTRGKKSETFGSLMPTEELEPKHDLSLISAIDTRVNSDMNYNIEDEREKLKEIQKEIEKNDRKLKKNLSVQEVHLALNKCPNVASRLDTSNSTTTSNLQLSTSSPLSSSLIPIERNLSTLELASIQGNGPLIRKAIRRTVDEEVTFALNEALNGPYLSKQLTKSIKSAYTDLKPVQKPKGGGKDFSSGPSVSPIKKHQNTLKAYQTDWLTKEVESMTEDKQDEEDDENERETSLIVEIPLGLNDTIEKILYSASLRSFSPPFFNSSTNNENKSLVHFEFNNNAYNLYSKLPNSLIKSRFLQQSRQAVEPFRGSLLRSGIKFINDLMPIKRATFLLQQHDLPYPLILTIVQILRKLSTMNQFLIGKRSEPMNVLDAENEVDKENEKETNKPDIITSSSIVPTNLSTSISSPSSVYNKYKGKKYCEEDLEDFNDEDDDVIYNAASTMLVNMIDQFSCQCRDNDMSDSVEEVLTQAAYFLLPVPSKELERKIDSKKYNKEGHEEIILSRENFIHFIEDLRKRKNKDKQEDLIRQRFRSCYIYINSYILSIKLKGINTIKDLFSVQLNQLNLPKQLESEIEVLFYSILARINGSNLIKTAEFPHDINLVQPIYLDTKFQTSHLDPFGKIPNKLPNQYNSVYPNKSKKDENIIKKNELENRQLFDSKVKKYAHYDDDFDLPAGIFNNNNNEEFEETKRIKGKGSKLISNSNSSLLVPIKSHRDSTSNQIVRHACPYPNCQVTFTKTYHLNIHMKTHNTNSFYHDYKHTPQLGLDEV